jgi:acyl-CoA synthetase (AMP-forming)/AMP-acid ligase II
MLDLNAVAIRRAEIEAGFRPMSIGQFVTERCKALGEAIALDAFDRDERATYAEVERMTNRIGNALKALGIRRGDRVGMMLSNRLFYPLAWLALAKIGAVHVPVNTRYTPREIAYVTGDSGATALIIEQGFLATFEAIETRPEGLPDDRVLVVDGAFDDAVAAASDAPCLDPEVGPDDLMNIQYTSGTTGFPKGCMLTHEYWLMLGHAAQAWDIRPVSRMLTAQPFFYMDPQWHVIKAMGLGATLYMAPQLSATRFIGWVKRYRVEWCQFPELMTRQPAEADDGDTALVQVATFGWSPETARAFKARFGVRAREGFGMTEIGMGAWMPPEADEAYDSASVGVAAPFREVTIRDPEGHEVPAGAEGELWVRGRGIFKGYWNKPDANADAFRGDWFRTGDIFRADERGLLWLTGRIKDMIRRSSENIAAREVEAVIREIDAVEDCAAVAVPDPRRGEEVKIYIQRKPGMGLEVGAILAHARARLAGFKVPRYIAFVDGFPRTVSNKIEKRNLPGGVAGSYDAEAGGWI